MSDMDTVYILGIALGLLVGVLTGYVMSTIILMKRSLQDIHDIICPTGAGDREKEHAPNTP